MIMEVKRSSNVKTAVSVAVPFVLLAVMFGYVFGPGSELIDSVHSSEIITIDGQSGCGKTTLLNMIGGLDIADSG